jgi:hypothetical protein
MQKKAIDSSSEVLPQHLPRGMQRVIKNVTGHGFEPETSRTKISTNGFQYVPHSHIGP